VGLTFWQEFEGLQGRRSLLPSEELLFDHPLAVFELVGVVSAISERELPN